MKQENIHDWFEHAKDFAKAERELEIEHWIKYRFDSEGIMIIMTRYTLLTCPGRCLIGGDG